MPITDKQQNMRITKHSGGACAIVLLVRMQ